MDNTITKLIDMDQGLTDLYNNNPKFRAAVDYSINTGMNTAEAIIFIIKTGYKHNWPFM